MANISEGVPHQMVTQLSILIPTYNRICVGLVRDVQVQAQVIAGLDYEIIVADDASTDPGVRSANEGIRSISGCRLIILGQNLGRSKVRNFLAREAKMPWLLFLDSDIQIPNADFLSRYLEFDWGKIVYGGVSVPPDGGHMSRNLRYRYERSCLKKFEVGRREKNPYQSFRTTNFMVLREVMLRHPFDEGITHYGYEDVLFGRSLQQAGIAIRHIDNPVLIDDFEPNDIFVRKTEEGLRTLYQIRSQMATHSYIVALANGMEKYHLMGIIRLTTSPLLGLLRTILLHMPPVVGVYNMYRLLYFISLYSSRK